MTSAPQRPRLARTRATLLVYAMLGFYGWFVYGFGPIVPLLRDEQGTSRTVASLHGTALAIGALLAGAIYPVLVRRFGRGRTLWAMVTGLGVGVLLLIAVPSVPAATILAALFCGTAGSTLVNGAAPTLLDLHGSEVSGAALTEANAIACGTGLVAPLAVGFSLDLGLGWRPALAVASLLALAIAVTARLTGAGLTSVPQRTTHPDADGVPPPTTGNGDVDEPAARPPLPRRYWLAWGVTLCCIAGEFASTLWASDVVRTHTGASAALATVAVTAVVGGMCAGRIVGAWLSVRHASTALLLPALAIALVGACVFWLATGPLLAMVGLAICGLGLGPTFPLAVDLALIASRGQSDRAAGYTSYAAGLAIGGGPFALGALADRIGPHTAYLVVPLLFCVAAVGVVAVRRSEVVHA